MTGLICVYKPQDITSFGVVAKLRGILREKKAGHTGTLDPMATGVLPVLLGGATRFLDFLPDSDKGYRAAFQLGKTTDTLDCTGTVTGTYAVTVGLAEVETALAAFRGTISQLPPMYSAVSVDGQRLYALARQGIEVERKPRAVEIKSLSLVPSLCNAAENTYTIDVLCSKGTYIRTLVDDIGRLLSCGAVLTALERTQAMGFTLADCVTLDELQLRRNENASFADLLLPVEQLFADLPRLHVTAAQARRFANGGALDGNRLRIPLRTGLYTVFSPDDLFLGLGAYDAAANELRVKRILARRD